MTPYDVQFTREALKDLRKLSPKLRDKLHDILTLTLALDPMAGKRLVGDLEGFYSFRLTYQDRIVYSVDRQRRVLYIHRCRTHYGD